MDFDFCDRLSDSPHIERIWSTRNEQERVFTSIAVSHVEFVISRYQRATTMTLRGPETVASTAQAPANGEFFGIQLKIGCYIPMIPTPELVDAHRALPEARQNTFWLHGAAWELPNFENAETFIGRLARAGLLAREPVVEDTLDGLRPDLSTRMVQRRFQRATGLTQGTYVQIERARKALELLQSGVSILDAVEQTGYSDQPHLTRSLKRFVGQTPAQIQRSA